MLGVALPFDRAYTSYLAWYTAFCFSVQAGSYDYQHLTERGYYSVMAHRTSGEYVLCPVLMATAGKALTHIGKEHTSYLGSLSAAGRITQKAGPAQVLTNQFHGPRDGPGGACAVEAILCSLRLQHPLY